MLRGTTDQRELKALHQRFHIVQFPLMTRKGETVTEDKIQSKRPHQTLSIVQLTALKRATTEIIEKLRPVTDMPEIQTPETRKSPLQINMLSAAGSSPKRGEGIDYQRIIKGRRRDDVKMKPAESTGGVLRQRRAENVRKQDQKNQTKVKMSAVRKDKKRHTRT